MGDADVAEIDVELVALGLLAGLADRHHDAAPVGVLARAGGLDQRRIGDRERDPLGRLARGRALDADLDELARALAVADDLMGEIEQQLVERALEGGEARIGGVGDLGRAALSRGAGREQQQRVGGRGVAVDGDAVERALHRLRQQRLQRRRGDRRVGEDERQHRRHVGRDHAGALGDAVDDDLGLADLDALRRDLRERVGRHDRARGVHQRVGLGARDQGVERARRSGWHRAARRSRRSRP